MIQFFSSPSTGGSPWRPQRLTLQPRLILSLIAICCIPLTGGDVSGKGTTSRPNIVFILADDMD
ncbi:hypothetical protein [Roseiconus lacunae]|uniref:Sulfatase N-terminal domain-containing protein n=1 Tax=Roseiconus lacunae TaxID=2605694 RepID=A0ABT7PFS5_9BACT|nr:hypothetical protein [Roseiconus lacunae]MDM4015061.1 hypothetical protein [Roseiconus lacunae]